MQEQPHRIWHHFRHSIGGGLLACLLLTPANVNADEASYHPFNHLARYNFTWGSVSVGYLIIDTREAADKYTMKAVIRAQGMAQIISKHKSDSSVEGRVESDKSHHPKAYSTVFETRGKGKDIKLQYDNSGAVTKEVSIPPENRDKRPEVPAKDKIGAIDPLSATFEARRFIQQWRAGSPETNFKLRVYDGRRLMWLRFSIVGKETIRVGKESYPSIHINGRREAIAGFTNNELKRVPKEEPEVDLYISDDDKTIPLYLKASAIVGTVYASLAKTCVSIEDCSKK